MSTQASRNYNPSYFRSSSHGSTASSNSENLPPRTLARVAREMRDLQKKPPQGITLVVDPETGCSASLGEIYADIEGPAETPYESRFFQLKLVIPSDFPSSPPRGFFLTKIYHPNVDVSNGAICVNTLKRDWTPETSLSHVFSVIRCLLIVPFPESSLNDEAGKLFMDSYEEYARRASLLAKVHARSVSSSLTDTNGNKNATFDEFVASATPGKLSGSKSCLNSLVDKSSLPNQRRSSKKAVAEKKSKKKGLKRL